MPSSGIPCSSENSKGEKNSPYAGRWIAYLREKIIGHGGTPEQALRSAKAKRYKENPRVVYMPVNSDFPFQEIVETIREALPKDQPVYLVGGAVRDSFLGRTTHDLDFALRSDGIKTARRLADKLGAAFFPIDKERDTGRVILRKSDGRRTVLDFAAFRGPDLESDLRGRDFTINALAIDISTMSVYDPLGGVEDIRNHQLKPCSESCFEDDPIRILRAVRLASSYGLKILPVTKKGMKEAVNLLPKVSPERVRDELIKILAGNQPSAAFRALDILGVLEIIFPELCRLQEIDQPKPHVHDVWMHTLSVIRHLEGILAALSPVYDPQTASDLFNGLLVMRLGRYRNQVTEYLDQVLVEERPLRSLLFFAALFHDVAKPSSSQMDEDGRLRYWGHDEKGALQLVDRGKQLQFSRDEVKWLELAVRHHMRIHLHVKSLIDQKKAITRRSIYRYFRDTGNSGIGICLLALADFRATYEQTLPQDLWEACLDVCRALMENWWIQPEMSISPRLLLNGSDIMDAFDLDPGPLIGKLIESLQEAQAAGFITDRDMALDFLAKILGDKK